MEQEKINKMIDAFFHDELTNVEETFLFTVLAENEFTATYFKEMLKFHEAVKMSGEEVPKELDDKILNKIISVKADKENSKFNIRPLLVYLIAGLFFILSLFFYRQLQGYHEELMEVRKIVNYQNKEISLFMNSLPAAKVNETFKNQVIVQKNL